MYDQGDGVYKYQIVDPNNGSYTVVATKDGDLNYLDLSSSMVIRVAEIQEPLVLDMPTEIEYSVSKEVVLSISGGSGNGLISFEGTNVSGTILSYETTGSYGF